MTIDITHANRFQLKTLPPGPRIASLQSFRYYRDPYGYCDEMKARYGDLFTMPTMNGTLIIAMSADHVTDILGRRDLAVGFGFGAIEPVLGRDSLLLTAGDQHRRDRKILSPIFHGNRMRAYAPIVTECVERELSSWTVDREFCVRDAMENISIEVIIRAAFGVQSPERVLAFRTAIREAVLEVNPAILFFKFLQHDFFGYGPWSRLKRKLARLDSLIYQQVEETRASSSGREDMLSRLLEARGDDGTGLDDSALRDQLVTFLFAGHETTATTLSWAFSEAFRQPAILGRLRDEIAALGPSPDPKGLSELPYLDAFCLETLRAHPILPEFFRTVTSDDFEFAGCRIPRGVSLAGSILMVHRDERVYDNPLAFEPQRFIEHKYSPHEFLSFGGGQRRCIGEAFATQEMKLVLGTILPRVDLASRIAAPLKTVRRNGTLAPEANVPVRVARRLES
jgi:cytochrome P450